MKNYFTIYLYGSIIILEGIFLLLSDFSTFKQINLVSGISLLVGAVLAFLSALSRQRKQVQFAYHELHAIAMLVYGISILVFSNNFEKFISITAFLFIFYAFSEIIFCNWLFNLSKKVIYKIIFVRVLLGLFIGLGTVVAMNDGRYTLIGFGALFILVGINIMLYVPVMKENNYDVMQFANSARAE